MYVSAWLGYRSATTNEPPMDMAHKGLMIMKCIRLYAKIHVYSFDNVILKRVVTSLIILNVYRSFSRNEDVEMGKREDQVGPHQK